jgi:hypothetical protein
MFSSSSYGTLLPNRLLKNDLTPSAMGPAIGIFSGPVDMMDDLPTLTNVGYVDG